MTSDTRGETGVSGRPEPLDGGEPVGSTSTTTSDTSETPVASGAPQRRQRRLGRWLWLLAPLMAVAFGAGGALYTMLSDVNYSASTLVEVDAATVAQNESLDQIDDQEISTQRLVMNSEAVAASVVKALQLDASVQAMQNSVNVQQVNDSRVLRLTATWNSPDGAAAVANAFAQQYLAYRTSQRDAHLGQLEAGNSGLRPGPVGQVLTPAVPSHVPSGPSPTVVIVLSSILGLLVGIVLAVLLDRRKTSGSRAA